MPLAPSVWNGERIQVVRLIQSSADKLEENAITAMITNSNGRSTDVIHLSLHARKRVADCLHIHVNGEQDVIIYTHLESLV